MPLSVETLQKIPQFDGVPDQQLQWLIDKSSCTSYVKGEYIFTKGDPIDSLFIILKGHIEIKLEQNGNYKLVTKMTDHHIGGLLPFSRASVAIGFGEVVKKSDVLILEEKYFREMVAHHYELTESFVHKMTSRVREFTKSNVQAEKMMALGKLSAGLAHELNNPASAILRSAKLLKAHLANVPEKFKRLASLRASEEEIDVINTIVFDHIKTRNHKQLKLSERSIKEDELEFWLEEHGVEDAFELTETLLDFQVDKDDLQKMYDSSGPGNFSSAIEWVENVLTTEKIVDEIKEASDRISNLVNSIKTYTHMDQSPEKVATDIHKGLSSTLTMLNHKLKKKNIELKTEFAENLPEPKILVSEINQVWTNLIDNAIDALEPSGVLTIKTSEENNTIKTEIIDNGKGISEENIDRIFDPFFTTKPIGAGTGMGLEVVQRIVQQHQGTIEVVSKPGHTVFTVCLPI
ncbi:ATP-binding protein [Aquimarina sp. ERC-38]|uniref:ATP-binding protein n=1 Tax=Aquimarina sp. ERC-38 TaxID=2949996 RepID=UPI0022468EA3|nr:ATP-binding protein [Aquimarina sp. ERC-38]UZO80522.1 ATP-binding protein [Aquimarina sp. ERC-38]